MTLSYSGLRKVTRMDLSSEVPLSCPLTIHVEPTSLCNFNCSFCPVSLPTYSSDAGVAQHMNFSLYCKILKDIADMGKIRSLKLYMVGEPFLNPDLPKMVRIAVLMHVAERIEITTNGSLVSGDVVDEILHSGLDYLRFSIYATGDTQITRNVRNIVARRDELGLRKPYICVKYIGRTQRDIDRFTKTYEGVGDEQIVEPIGNWGDTIQLASPSTKQVCPFIFYMLGIKANGDVMPCCIDWKATLRLGNVKERSIKAIWNGPERAKIIESHLIRERSSMPVCVSCTLPSTTPDNLDGLTLDDYKERLK